MGENERGLLWLLLCELEEEGEADVDVVGRVGAGDVGSGEALVVVELDVEL